MTNQFTFTARSAAALVEEFEQALNANLLKPGQRLPSVRALATQLGVSPSTIASAFAELRRQGLIVTRSRGASWVNERPPVRGLLSPVMIPPGTVDLATGNPDPAVLPTLAPALSAIAETGTTRLYGADSVSARLTDPVVTAFRRSSQTLTDMENTAINRVVVSGALDGIERALTAMLPRPSRVGLEDPGYDTLIGLVRAMGHEPVPLPVDRNGPDTGGVRKALESGLDAVVVTSRAQNPTGSAVSFERAEELRAILSEHPTVAVIENDHLGNIAGAPLASLCGATTRWVHVHSFAKSLGPDLRVAVMLGDSQTIDRVRGRLSLGPGWVSEILEDTIVTLLEDPATTLLLEEANAHYGRRRATLARELDAVGIEVDPGTGFNIWIPVVDETSIVTGLLTRGWAVAPGSRYRIHSSPGIRVTVSSMTDEQAHDFAQTLATIATCTPGRYA